MGTERSRHLRRGGRADLFDAHANAGDILAGRAAFSIVAAVGFIWLSARRSGPDGLNPLWRVKDLHMTIESISLEVVLMERNYYRNILIDLVHYCEDHNWGTIPVGKIIEEAVYAVRNKQPNP